jgi:hypothetical protein
MRPLENTIPFGKFKALLGTLADALTDEEIEDLRIRQHHIADAIIDWWIRKRKEADSPD